MGTVWRSVPVGREKEMILRSEEDGGALHIYICRQHHETHQTF
jgi:hypothetical protein